MASYNPNNGQQSQFADNFNPTNQSFFSNILRRVSNYGMDTTNMVVKNRVAISINEDPRANNAGDLYSLFSNRAMASLMSKKTIPYLQYNNAEKRRILREYSTKDEIRDMITTIADESIVYNEEKKFCKLRNLPNEYSQDIKDKYNEIFEKAYNAFGFNDGVTAWNYFRRFLIDGSIAFELIFDDHQKNIIGMEMIEAASIMPAYDETGVAIWIQNPEDPQNRRILLDAQILLITYSAHNEYGEMSYLEGLIRPYNQLKIIEQTRIMFNMVNATIYQKFTIPINGLSKQRAEEEISRLIADYSEEVEWDDSLGTVSINGSKHLPFHKQLWFPSGESGSPTLEMVAPEGHNLNESDMLTWFFNALKRASKIPFSRFDKDNGGGNVYGDAAEMTRDEVKFSNFINRLRMVFKEIITKPIKIQMLVEFPELIKDELFLNSIGVDFNSNDLFEEWKRLNNLSKRIEIASSMASSLQDAEGNAYFHMEYVIDKIVKLTEEEKQENKAYKLKELSGKSTGDGTMPDTGGGGGGADFGGGDTGGAPDTGGPAEPPTPDTEPPAEGPAPEGDFEF